MQQLKEVQILARFEFQNPPNPPTQRFTSLILQQQRMPRVAMGYFLLCSSTHFVAQVLSLRYKCLTLTLNPFLSSTYQKLYRPRLTALEKVVASGVPKKLATAFAASLTSVPFIQFFPCALPICWTSQNEFSSGQYQSWSVWSRNSASEGHKKGHHMLSTNLAAEAAPGWGPAPTASIQIHFGGDRYSTENIYGFQENWHLFSIKRRSLRPTPLTPEGWRKHNAKPEPMVASEVWQRYSNPLDSLD